MRDSKKRAIPMRSVRGRGERPLICPQVLLTKALAGVIHAAAQQIHPSVFHDIIRGVGAQLGRSAASEYRLIHKLRGPFDSHACAQCLEAVGKQCGWTLRVVVESDDVLRVTVLECVFTEPHESGSYLCELAAGLFAGVAAEALGYAKICAGSCSETPPLDSTFTIYLQESEKSLAAPGIVYRLRDNELALLAEGSLDGGPGQRLTRRETQVLQLIARGLSDKKIAATLQLSVRTVENHAAQIRQKLGIDSRTGLVRFAFRTHLVES
jgi:DNA-binding CsgD family transcriptional regulator